METDRDMDTDRDMEKKQIENGGQFFCFLESALHDTYTKCVFVICLLCMIISI